MTDIKNAIRIATAAGAIGIGLIISYFAGDSEFLKSIGVEIVGAGIVVFLLDQSAQALLTGIERIEIRRQERVAKLEAERQEALKEAWQQQATKLWTILDQMRNEQSTINQELVEQIRQYKAMYRAMKDQDKPES